MTPRSAWRRGPLDSRFAGSELTRPDLYIARSPFLASLTFRLAPLAYALLQARRTISSLEQYVQDSRAQRRHRGCRFHRFHTGSMWSHSPRSNGAWRRAAGSYATYIDDANAR
jgi:hypothetical protein